MSNKLLEFQSAGVLQQAGQKIKQTLCVETKQAMVGARGVELRLISTYSYPAMALLLTNSKMVSK